MSLMEGEFDGKKFSIKMPKWMRIANWVIGTALFLFFLMLFLTK